MKYSSHKTDTSNTFQFIYSLAIILLIPLIIVLNSVFLLTNMKDNMNYELNNKALITETVIAQQVRTKIDNTSLLLADIKEVTAAIPEIQAIEVVKIDSRNNILSLASTSPITKQLSDPVIDKLSWSSNQAYSKQIYTTLNATPQRLWVIVSPITDTNKNTIALINLYLSAAQIDTITQNTITKSIIILVGSILITLLLLFNHFRFFEMSVLFTKLQDVDRMKDDFISIASHELRTPLTVLRGYVSLLADEPLIRSHKQLQGKVGEVSKNIQRLNNLVDDLLDTSRIEQNTLLFHMEDFDIRDIMQKVVADTIPLAHDKGLKLVYEPYDKPLIVHGDRNKMTEIFSNVVTNAIKYTLTGNVTITQVIEHQSVKTSITDSGIGISHEGIEKLFGKFSRIYNDKTKDIPGTGLGLWITKRLTEKMDGTISVESIEGQGSVFILRFPLTNG